MDIDFKTFYSSSIKDDMIPINELPIKMASLSDIIINDLNIYPTTSSGQEIFLDTSREYNLFDGILNNNLNIISNVQSFEKLKDYEKEYDCPSEEFYKKWIHGKIQPAPEIYEWMTIYKNLFITT